VTRQQLQRHGRKWYLEDRIDARYVEDVFGVFGQLQRSPAGDRLRGFDDREAVAVLSRNANIGGMPGQRNSSPTSTVLDSSSAWSATASPVASRMPVCTPAGTPSVLGTSASVILAPGGATSIHRPLGVGRD
jgi:hypothetical protein